MIEIPKSNPDDRFILIVEKPKKKKKSLLKLIKIWTVQRKNQSTSFLKKLENYAFLFTPI